MLRTSLAVIDATGESDTTAGSTVIPGWTQVNNNYFFNSGLLKVSPTNRWQDWLYFDIGSAEAFMIEVTAAWNTAEEAVQLLVGDPQTGPTDCEAAVGWMTTTGGAEMWRITNGSSTSSLREDSESLSGTLTDGQDAVWRFVVFPYAKSGGSVTSLVLHMSAAPASDPKNPKGHNWRFDYNDATILASTKVGISLNSSTRGIKKIQVFALDATQDFDPADLDIFAYGHSFTQHHNNLDTSGDTDPTIPEELQTWLRANGATGANVYARGNIGDGTRDITDTNFFRSWFAEAIARQADMAIPFQGINDILVDMLEATWTGRVTNQARLWTYAGVAFFPTPVHYFLPYIDPGTGISGWHFDLDAAALTTAQTWNTDLANLVTSEGLKGWNSSGYSYVETNRVPVLRATNINTNAEGDGLHFTTASGGNGRQLYAANSLGPDVMSVVDAGDTTAPTAVLTSAPDVTSAGGTSYDLTITFSDDVAVSIDSLQTGNIVIIGPDGTTYVPTFISVDVGTDGTPRVATYRLTPPGGSWDTDDNGTYEIKTVG